MLMTDQDPTVEDLRAAIQLACQPQNTHRILSGREIVLGMPRTWVLQTIESVANECLDLTDEWEYRRLLELADALDGKLLQGFGEMGNCSNNEEIREAANDFRIA